MAEHAAHKDKVPEGHVLSHDQVDGVQPLQGMTDTQGHVFPVVVSTGRTHADEREAERILAENPPQDVVPAQDPFAHVGKEQARVNAERESAREKAAKEGERAREAEIKAAEKEGKEPDSRFVPAPTPAIARGPHHIAEESSRPVPGAHATHPKAPERKG